MYKNRLTKGRIFVLTWQVIREDKEKETLSPGECYHEVENLGGDCESNPGLQLP